MAIRAEAYTSPVALTLARPRCCLQVGGRLDPVASSLPPAPHRSCRPVHTAACKSPVASTHGVRAAACTLPVASTPTRPRCCLQVAGRLDPVASALPPAHGRLPGPSAPELPPAMHIAIRQHYIGWFPPSPVFLLLWVLPVRRTVGWLYFKKGIMIIQ